MTYLQLFTLEGPTENRLGELGSLYKYYYYYYYYYYYSVLAQYSNEQCWIGVLEMNSTILVFVQHHICISYQTQLSYDISRISYNILKM